MRIFLDLDGVIKDWSGAIYKLFDCEPLEIRDWHDIDNHIKKLYGISTAYFWERQDRDFWLSLEFFPWAVELLELLPYKNTCLLTSPAQHNAGWVQEWIKINMPDFFNDKKYLIGPAKHFCANENSLLIDDADHNVDKFVESGGKAILFPQTWNKNRKYINDRIDYMKAKLKLHGIVRGQI